MDTEGSLSIRLVVSAGRVGDVHIAYTRPVRASSALAGRPHDEVLRLVPLLFPVCGIAHGAACARAIDAALARTPDARLEAARHLACLAEAAVSHVWQLSLAWPLAMAGTPDLGALRAARAALRTLSVAIFADPAGIRALRADVAMDAVREAVTRLVGLVDEQTLVAPPLLGEIRRVGRAGFGAANTPAVARLDPDAAGALLAADAAFAEHPELDGMPVDVSAFAREGLSEAVEPIEEEHGPGLLARLAARWVAARTDMERLAAAVSRLDAHPPHTVAARAAAGAGTGAADTARGPLVYRVRATAGQVQDVRVVSPTDWTFHPRGVLRNALVGADATPTLARDAGWLVLALDPCVPWTIEVHDA